MKEISDAFAKNEWADLDKNEELHRSLDYLESTGLRPDRRKDDMEELDMDLGHLCSLGLQPYRKCDDEEELLVSSDDDFTDIKIWTAEDQEWIDDPWAASEKCNFSKESLRFPNDSMFIHVMERYVKTWDEIIERLRQYPGNETGDALTYYPPGHRIDKES